MNRVLGLIVVIPLLSSAAAAADGVWTLRERFCVSVDGARQCSRGSEDFMFFEGRAYYRPGADDYWSEAGTVTTKGKRVRVQVTREGIGRVVARHAGIDVSDYLQDFSFTYAGRVQGTRIVDGKARINLGLEVQGERHRIRGAATFAARRIGDAYPIPPPDPYFGELSGVPSRGSIEPGAFSTLKSAVRDLVGWPRAR